jgi:soluble lytic murein transglycosylase-like protein
LIAASLLPAMSLTAQARPPLEELSSGKVLYRRLAEAEAIRNDIPFAIVDAVMRVESNYDPKARGGAGEIGLMQVLPSTAALMGFEGSAAALAAPGTNISYGTRYLAEAWRLGGQDICTAVMKYRAGHGETRFSVKSVSYCRSVRKHLALVGFPVTGDVPKPTFGFAEGGLPAKGRIRLRLDGVSKCFARVIQPGKRYGACISTSALRKRGLLK